MNYKNEYNVFDGTKSIGINQLPREAWTSLSGGSSYGNSSIAKDAYRTLGIANRCVAIRSNAIASLPWTVSDMNGNNIYSTDDAMLPEKLVFLKSFKQKLYLIESSLSIFARSYLFLYQPFKSKDSLQWVLSSSVDPIWDTEEGIVGFRRNLSKEDQRDFDVGDVAYFLIPNPLDEMKYGVSPLEAAADAANVNINLNAFANHFIERGAIKATLLRVDPSMQKKDRESLKNWWSGMMNGLANAWKTNVLSTAVEPVVVGEGLKDIADHQISRSKAEDVAVSMGVPFSVVFSNAANHATSITDQRNMYNFTILPEADLIAEELNEKLFNPLGYIFNFEEEMIKIFQNSEKERAETYKIYVDGKIKPSIAAQIAGLTLPPQLEFDDLDEDSQDVLEGNIDGQSNENANEEVMTSDDSENSENNDDQNNQNNSTKESEDFIKESSQFRRWAKKRIKDNDPNDVWSIKDFTAEFIDSATKRKIVSELLQQELENDEGDDDEEDYFPDGLDGIKEKRPLEITGSDDSNNLTETTERKAVTGIQKGLSLQKAAIFEGNEDKLDADPSEVNLAALLSAPTRVETASETASDALRRALIEGVDLGTKTAIKGLEGIGIGFDYTLVNVAARQWADRNVGELISGINNTTKRSVQTAVSQWIQNGESLRQLERELRPTFGKQRAELIASTEVTKAFAEGNRLAFADSGVVQKIEWRAAADERVCPICGPLHGKRGDLNNGLKGMGFPPAHPRCRCWIVPVVEVNIPKPKPKPTNKNTNIVDVKSTVHKDSLKTVKFSDGDGYSKRAESLAKQAIESLSKVHTFDGKGIQIEGRNYNQLSFGTAGEYYHSKGSSDVGRINVYQYNFTDGDVKLTTIHEFGHYLDKQNFGLIDDKNAAVTDVKEIMKELEKTKAVKNLLKLGDENPTINWYQYTTTEKEIFARAYSQYIATKLNDKEMLESIEELSKNDFQWTTKEFKPIVKLFDKLIIEKGWIR